jgi:hypothetical protein
MDLPTTRKELCLLIVVKRVGWASQTLAHGEEVKFELWNLSLTHLHQPRKSIQLTTPCPEDHALLPAVVAIRVVMTAIAEMTAVMTAVEMIVVTDEETTATTAAIHQNL